MLEWKLFTHANLTGNVKHQDETVFPDSLSVRISRENKKEVYNVEILSPSWQRGKSIENKNTSKLNIP